MKFNRLVTAVLIVFALAGLAYLDSPSPIDQIERITQAYEQGQISLETLGELRRFFLDQQLR
jgi:hypothetical protein